MVYVHILHRPPAAAPAPALSVIAVPLLFTFRREVTGPDAVLQVDE